MPIRKYLRASVFGIACAVVSVSLPVPVDAFSLGRSLKSFEEERQEAVSQHAQIVEQFGGVYDDAEMAAYVDRVGQRLVANSDMAGRPFTFTILNSPIVNAFTVGGGQVYVTRGILAAMNTEAEMAALLGHEIAHVTERHSARREERMKQDRAASIGVGLLSGSLSAALLTDVLGDVNRTAYSRRQEADSDEVGLRFMTQAGYDPFGMPNMLRVLEREVALAQKMSGGDGGVGVPAWLQDHPQTADRIRDTLAQAERTGLAPGAREVGVEAHLDAIDGVLYGTDPLTGVVRDGRFLHTGLGFAFDVPDGYQLVNQLGLLVGIAESEDFFVFAGAEWSEDRSLEEFALSAWYSATEGNAGSLDTVTETEINGLDAIVSTKEVRKFGLSGNIVSISFRTSPEAVYGFSFISSGELTQADLNRYVDIASGFTLLSPGEVAEIKPYRVRVITAGSLDTFETLAEQTAFSNFAVDRLRALNGIEGEISVGDRVKLIVEE